MAEFARILPAGLQAALEQRTDRGACQPLEVPQAPDVRPGQRGAAKAASSGQELTDGKAQLDFAETAPRCESGAAHTPSELVSPPRAHWVALRQSIGTSTPLAIHQPVRHRICVTQSAEDPIKLGLIYSSDPNI